MQTCIKTNSVNNRHYRENNIHHFFAKKSSLGRHSSNKSKARVSVILQNLLAHEEEQQTAQKSNQKSDGSRGLGPLSLQEWDPFSDIWLGIFPGHPPSNKHTLLNHTCTHKIKGDSVGYCN